METCPQCGAVYDLQQTAEYRDYRAARSGYVCAQCGSGGKPKRKAKGSFAVEIALWVVGFATLIFGVGFIVVIGALIYSVWRMFGGKTMVCRSCGSADLVPGESPRGRELLERFGYTD